MSVAAHIFTFGLCIAVGHSSQLIEQESSFVHGMLKDLPTATCDMIAVSTLPLLGEILIIYHTDVNHENIL